MKTTITTFLTGCLFAAASVPAFASPAIVASFLADPGQSDVTYKMASCHKVKTKVYIHYINLYGDGTFEQVMDLDGPGAAPNFVTTGLWVEPKPGNIQLTFDGDITEGASGTGSWGAVMTAAEQNLIDGCSDLYIKLMYATVRTKNMSMRVNGKGDRAKLDIEIDSYAQGGNTRPGKAHITVQAPGKFERSI